ncbi:MAG TPA: ArsA family ATPase [Solirubrobacteraceae bacterium]|nr:ArsA family ATPase [Solirubrobacteraceae bacterium]
MAPRTILYTGKGGVGKTSVAAATARRLAASGRRTLLVSTDPAHSLADVLGVTAGSRPAPASPGLDVQQISAQDELDRHWSEVQDWLGDLLVRKGVDRIAAEELTVLPGMDELFGLLEIGRHYDDAFYDAIVVDCAPTGETLRLLSFPDAARWWLDKALPQQSRMVAAARPFSRGMPSEGALDDVQRVARGVIAMNEVLRDHEHVSIRLVLTPERLVVDETRRTFTYLSLYGFLTDAVIANRVLPPESGDWLAGWRAHQQHLLGEARDAFAPVPVLNAPHFAEEVLGPAMLDRLGDEIFGGVDAAAILHDRVTQELTVGAREAELRLDLPFAHKGDVHVKRIGNDLVVRVNGSRRTLALPPALSDYQPTGAALTDGVLHVTFDRPDPADA